MKIRQALGLAGSIPLGACVLTACSGNVVVDSSAGAAGAGGAPATTTASGSAANGTGGAPNTTVVSSAVSGQVTSTGPATVTVGSSTGTMTGGAGLGARCSSDAECAMGCMTQVDCMNGTCTNTKFGRFCIDLQFPLGTAAP